MDKRKTALAAGIAIALAIASAIWWFAFDSRAPSRADDAIPLAGLRAAAADQGTELPVEIELYRVGAGAAPMFAVQAGGGGGRFRMAYTAFGVRYANGRVMIDAAADRATAETLGEPRALAFDDAAYRLLLDRIAGARLIALTHEHKDHVMALVRHPESGGLIDRIWMPAAQTDGVLKHVADPSTAAALRARAIPHLERPTRIAPGIAVAPSPGHSPGSLIIYARLQNGREHLFVGDIAWSFDDIRKLKTRPRFLQWLMFDPDEQRGRVLAQLRALHDIQLREPRVVIVPSHDDAHLDALLGSGALTDAAPHQPDEG